MSHDTTRTLVGLDLADDPVERIARVFASRGWEVSALERNGSRRIACHPEHGRVTIARWALGLSVQLWVEHDEMLSIPAFCGSEQQDRICELIGISPRDLWARDLFDDDVRSALAA
jgi:hypothetical protein